MAASRPTRIRTILYPAERPFALYPRTPGPLLDALVAAEVLLRPVSLDNPAVPRYLVHAQERRGFPVPPFSTSETAMQIVIQRLRAALCQVELRQMPLGSWQCKITPPPTFETKIVARTAPTAPHAVCIAARIAMRPHGVYPRMVHRLQDLLTGDANAIDEAA